MVTPTRNKESHMERIAYTPAPADAVLCFQQQRIVTLLFAEFLQILESVENDHDIALDKLLKALPEQYRPFVDLADYLTPEKGQELRKRVLDKGNDTWRSLNDLVEKSFEVKFR